MKIQKFRIKNYKSIVDSGDVYPDASVTILAGKNEAGKSSLLEALEDFNTSKQIRDKALPLNNESQVPEISIQFEFSKDELISAFEPLTQSSDFAKLLIQSLSNSENVTVTKKYPNLYEFAWEKLDNSIETEKSVLMSLAFSINSALQTWELNNRLNKHGLSSFQVSASDFSTQKSSEEIAKVKASLGDVLAQDDETTRTSILAAVENAENALNQFHESIKTEKQKIRELFLKLVPNFILFSSFDDVFPSSIPIKELGNNSWIQDLKAMSDINIEIISNSNPTIKKRHKTALNVTVNEDFRQFWTQDDSQLSIDWDSKDLQFWIEEDGEYYPPELRSQGRRWHLAFYIRVSARAKENRKNIILIDEPGLYLHATAQRDILKHLEQSSRNSQLLLSTHSPYLIEIDKLERLRLVLKTPETGTRVENKLHSVSDKETLTPILTAIGLELNQGIIASDKVNNVIVEGASDYFYLTALGEILSRQDIKFVSGGSSGNMPKVGTILQGWGAKVLYLYDNDQAYKDALKSIKKDWVSISKDWLHPLKVDGAVEDLFTPEEFASILQIEASEITGKNSEYLKATKREKVLPARLFLSRLRANEGFDLSKESRKTATTLFDLFKEKFEQYSY